MKQSILAVSLLLVGTSAFACYPNCAQPTSSSSTATQTSASGFVSNGTSVTVGNGGSAHVATFGAASSSAKADADALTYSNSTRDCCEQKVGGLVNGYTNTDFSAKAGIVAVTSGNATVNGQSAAGADSFARAESTIAGKLPNDAGQFNLTVGSGAGAGGLVVADVNEFGVVKGSTSTGYTGAAEIYKNICRDNNTVGGYVTKAEYISIPKATSYGNAATTTGASGFSYGEGSYNVGAKIGTFKF